MYYRNEKSIHLHHTKPGLVGHTYSDLQNIFNEDQQQQNISDGQNTSLQLTTEQIEQRKKNYEEKVKQLIEREKIPTNLLKELIELTKKVIEDYKNGTFLNDENESKNSDENTSRQNDEGKQVYLMN
ncbi:unnamed protein product [Rotaria sordida]|uniref:Uncharacterized protein n=1 Tax=Rotaria sordida TaxID=392033 RepID=A0A814CWH0_9BILA|nr:unnamed protein product [Rotaria sordida]CAF1336045.1 unnamed protein product [Rotaria sordida]